MDATICAVLRRKSLIGAIFVVIFVALLVDVFDHIVA
jgi:hypothetical protein